MPGTEFRASERAAHALITEIALQPLFLGLVILTVCLLWSVGGMLYLMLIVIVHQIHALQVSPVTQFSFWLDSIFLLVFYAFDISYKKPLPNSMSCSVSHVFFYDCTVWGSYIEGLFPFSSNFYIWHLVKVRTHSFICQCWSCETTRAAVGSWGQGPCCLLYPRSVILLSSRHMTITIFPSPLSHHHLWGLPQSLILHTDWLWVSVLTTIYCNKYTNLQV